MSLMLDAIETRLTRLIWMVGVHIALQLLTLGVLWRLVPSP